MYCCRYVQRLGNGEAETDGLPDASNSCFRRFYDMSDLVNNYLRAQPAGPPPPPHTGPVAYTFTGLTTTCKTMYTTHIGATYAAWEAEQQAAQSGAVTCRELVFIALNGTSKAYCPDTSVGSAVHACMAGHGNQVSCCAWMSV